MNAADKLIENILRTKNPGVIGLDPDIGKIPSCYKRLVTHNLNKLSDVAELIYNFNCDIIDTVAPFVPAVKPQMAFYEKYGSYGVAALEKTVEYARAKGLTVIEDAKRNDIGNTAMAYANGHLGKVELIDGSFLPSIDADFMTVTPFLGSESIEPFVKVCNENEKGIFVLVKTSNISSGEIQDAFINNGLTVSRSIARYVYEQGIGTVGKYGYSPIGAVVGATYPEEASVLRKMMPDSYFLVPGYGAQGGDASDIIPCFNEDGLGAIVNSSRGILYMHTSVEELEVISREEYLQRVKNAALQMKNEIYSALKNNYPNMIY